MGEHPVEVSKHSREAKQARFEGNLEQARFDAMQGARVAEQRSGPPRPPSSTRRSGSASWASMRT